MEYKYYAKSNPTETIKEHTDKLLENLEILKNEYGDKTINRNAKREILATNENNMSIS